VGDVFVSYAREDTAFVRRLHALLRGQGRDPWIDWNDIPPTAEWLSEIYAAIEQANAFAFVISTDSCSSDICLLEVEHAVQNHKRLIPILHRDVDFDVVPPPLARLNWILFRSGDDAERAASSLADALDMDLDLVRAHTRLQVRSIEWDREERQDGFLLRGESLERALDWLTRADNTTKPSPTALQREYVRASQKAEAQELKRVRDLYDRALAGKLAIQSRWLLHSERLGAQPLAMALAIESMRRSPSFEAEEALRRCIALQPLRVARLNHDYDVAAVAFSPTGDKLATASGRLDERESYDAEASGKSLEDFVDERDLQRFLDRGNMLIHDVSSNIAYLWDPFAGAPLARLEHGASVMSLAFSADGERLATAAADGIAKVWDTRHGEMISRIDLERPLWRGTVALTADGSVLIAQEHDRGAGAWDVGTGQRTTQHALAKATGEIASTDDSKRARLTRNLDRLPHSELESVAARLGISQRSAPAGIDLAESVAGEVTRRALVLSQDAACFADAHRYTTNSDTVSVFDTLGFERARIALDGFAAAAVFHPSGRYLCTAARRAVEIWNLTTTSTLHFLHFGTDVGFLAFSREGNYLVTAGAKSFADITPKAALWDVATREAVESPAGEEQRRLLAEATNPWIIADRENRLTATYKDPGRSVRVRDRASHRILAELVHNGWLRCAAFGPFDRLATGTEFGAHVWNARDGREIAFLRHSKQVRAVAFGTTADRLVTACDDNSARMWDVKDGHEILAVRHDDCVGAVAVSPDGRYLATGGDDNTARLWDITTHDEVARLLHQGPVRAVRFSPDGQILATGSLNGDVGLWMCRPDTLIDLAWQRLPRNLTPAEWNTYLPGEPYRATCGG
jgi:WD40 repeat protein